MTEQQIESKFTIGSIVMLSPEGITFVTEGYHDNNYLVPNRLYTVVEVKTNRFGSGDHKYRMKELGRYFWPDDYLTNIIEPDD